MGHINILCHKSADSCFGHMSDNLYNSCVGCTSMFYRSMSSFINHPPQCVDYAVCTIAINLIVFLYTLSDMHEHNRFLLKTTTTTSIVVDFGFWSHLLFVSTKLDLSQKIAFYKNIKDFLKHCLLTSYSLSCKRVSNLFYFPYTRIIIFYIRILWLDNKYIILYYYNNNIIRSFCLM